MIQWIYSVKLEDEKRGLEGGPVEEMGSCSRIEYFARMGSSTRSPSSRNHRTDCLVDCRKAEIK